MKITTQMTNTLFHLSTQAWYPLMNDIWPSSEINLNKISSEEHPGARVLRKHVMNTSNKFKHVWPWSSSWPSSHLLLTWSEIPRQNCQFFSPPCNRIPGRWTSSSGGRFHRWGCESWTLSLSQPVVCTCRPTAIVLGKKVKAGSPYLFRIKVKQHAT